MPQLADICDWMNEFAPLALAENWDNVGLLVGVPQREVNQVMTCLTLTPETLREAIAQGANLIVAHHPLPFKPVSEVTSNSTLGQLLLGLIENRIGLFSPHTAFDSARHGINAMAAEKLNLRNVSPLIENPLLQVTDAEKDPLGAGRLGCLSPPVLLREFMTTIQNTFAFSTLRYVGCPEKKIERVALACGSGGSFLEAAISQQADLLLTGETNFHTCLEAEAQQIALVLTGHFASERFAVESLAEKLGEAFPGVNCWASHDETDPVKTIKVGS